MGEIELKPCPFCGSAARILSNGIGDFYVKCHDCGVRTCDVRVEEPHIAAKLWNTRSPDTVTVSREDAPIDKYDADLIKALDDYNWKGVQSTLFRLTKSQADRLRSSLAKEPS